MIGLSPVGGEPPEHVSAIFEDLHGDTSCIGTEAGPALRGTLCQRCGLKMAGSRLVCSRCMGQTLEEMPLARNGNLYTFSQVHVGPAARRILGYVDLDDGVRTLAVIRRGAGPIVIGARVRLATDADAWFFETVHPLQDECEVWIGGADDT